MVHFAIVIIFIYFASSEEIYYDTNDVMNTVAPTPSLCKSLGLTFGSLKSQIKDQLIDACYIICTDLLISCLPVL
eukprot:scaffold9779_cov79-Skeletonema_marinoi.AAC.2